MNQNTNQNRPKLTLTDLERREVPAVFNIPNPAVVGQAAAQTAIVNAINTANDNNEDDKINLFPNALYTLELYNDPNSSAVDLNAFPVIDGDIDQNSDTYTVTINGRGATLSRNQQSSDQFRIFEVNNDGLLYLRNTTLENGETPDTTTGGAILIGDFSGIDVRNCLFRNNTSNFAGGALAFTINSDGGFLYNTTFTRNANFTSTEFVPDLIDPDTGGGGAIYVHPGSEKVIITNCTISGNDNFNSFLNFGSELYGAGIRGGDNIELTNTIVYGNFSNEINEDDINDGAEFEANNSIIGEFGTSVITGNNPQLNADPLLRPLAYNGGQSQTIALRAGSPAINSGNNGVQLPAGLTTDQRGTGFARRVGIIDVGAFEFKPNSRLTLRSSRNPSRVGDMVTFTATISPTTPLFDLRGAGGTVTFYINGKVVDTVNVVNNGRTLVATFSTNALPRGTHAIRAVYTDSDEMILDDAVGALSQVVGKQGRRWIR